MSFPPDVKVRALVACRRNCVLCGRFCGIKIELHHIKQHADGGEDTFENCIPLCFDCHSEVRMYNPKHPKGNRYTEAELIQRRDLFYQEINSGKTPCISENAAVHFDSLEKILKCLFKEDKDVIGAVRGYKVWNFSYGHLRNSVDNCPPQVVDDLVKWLSENNYVITDIFKDVNGEIVGSIKITQQGINLYFQMMQGANYGKTEI